MVNRLASVCHCVLSLAPVCRCSSRFMVALLFYCFAVMLVFAAVGTIVALNPVYAVLNLILTFTVSSALFVLMGSEFIAMLVVIVYVGAVAVLFLFVIMMLDAGYVKLTHGLVKFYPVGIVLGSVFFLCSLYAIFRTKVAYFNANGGGATMDPVGNVFIIGSQLYTKYFYAFQMVGLLLLTAAVGTLVLTLSFTKSKSLKQDVRLQVSRSSKVRLVSPKVGGGIDDL